MDNAGYATLTRQSGLLNEMRVIAQNIANVSTDGYQKEGLVFSEFVARGEDADASLSMATAHVGLIDQTQGELTQTNGRFDFAVEGEGYFMVQTADGPQLTRAGSFTPGPEGELVASDGARLMDAGGSSLFIPPDARTVALAPDGTLSVDGVAVGEVGVFHPADPASMTRAGGVRFAAKGDVEPVEDPRIMQGFLESSNVDPILEISRMIEVQRAYEQGQNLLSSEDERIRSVIQTLGK